MLVHRTKKLLVSSTSVGTALSYFHKQTAQLQIRGGKGYFSIDFLEFSIEN